MIVHLSLLFLLSLPSPQLSNLSRSISQSIMTSTDIATRELENPMDLTEYLFRRLHEVGIRAVHGVPGDYNLSALDYLPKCGLDWVGNCNELNAGV